MSISRQVQESLDDAEKHLRTALAFASRTEEAWVIKHISSCIMNIKDIPEIDSLTEHIEKIKKSLPLPGMDEV